MDRVLRDLRCNWNLAALPLALGNRHTDLEQTVFELGLSLVGLSPLRQGHDPIELAIAPLLAPEPALILLVLLASFAFNNYALIRTLHLDVVFLHPGEFANDFQFPVALPDLDGGGP